MLAPPTGDNLGLHRISLTLKVGWGKPLGADWVKLSYSRKKEIEKNSVWSH